MIKIPSGPSAFFDIDDTIVCWEKPDTATKEDIVSIDCRGVVSDFYINKHNLDFLIKLAKRGHAVVCWSAGGSDWAEAVVKALSIEKYVCAVATKPTYYIDDVKDSNEWIGKYRFYDFDGKKHYSYGSIVEKEQR